MKLKLSPNHMIFKLSPDEKKKLSHVGDKLTEIIQFSDFHTLTYSLCVHHQSNGFIQQLPNEIQFVLSESHCKALDIPSKEGLIFQLDYMRVSIEVDLYPGKEHACG